MTTRWDSAQRACSPAPRFGPIVVDKKPPGIGGHRPGRAARTVGASTRNVARTCPLRSPLVAFGACMSFVLEPQRIVARGPGSLPDVLLVDVGGLLRWMFEKDPSGASWSASSRPLLDAVKASHRQVAWAVAPTTLPSSVDHRLLVSAAVSLEGEGFDVIESVAPFPALVGAVATSATMKLALVMAGVDGWPYELWPLGAPGVKAILDIATGEVWTEKNTAEFFGSPARLPELHAIIGTQYLKPCVREAAQPSNAALLRAATNSGGPLTGINCSERVQHAIATKASEIEAAAEKLRASGETDHEASQALAAWLEKPNPRVEPVPAGTTYVLAEVMRTGGELHVRRARVGLGEHWRHADGENAALELLADSSRENSERWFAPHALDLLGAMADAGLRLPRVVIDPAVVAFALDPDAPPPLWHEDARLLSLSPATRRWLQDVEREDCLLSADEDLDGLASLLPGLDAALGVALTKVGLHAVVEDDVARTLPVFSRIERRGAWVELPRHFGSWDDVESMLHRTLRQLGGRFAFIARSVDPLSSDYRTLVPIIRKKLGDLPKERWSGVLSPEHEFNRYAALGHREVIALGRARSLASTALYWLGIFRSANGRLRGKHVPQVSGRWGLRAPALQNLVSRAAGARLLRTVLRPPPGYILVAADFNGFEGRLLAALSNDPLLVAAAQAPEFFTQLATVVFGDSAKRDLAKASLYSIIYGQGITGFQRAQAKVTLEESANAYARVLQAVPRALAYRDEQLREYRARRCVTTLGGWRRCAPNEKSAFNTVVQGLGADIFRRVIRRLDVELAGYDAFVVHLAHDDVVLATRPECERDVTEVLAKVMWTEALAAPALLPASFTLPVKIRRGATWAGLL